MKNAEFSIFFGDKAKNTQIRGFSGNFGEIRGRGNPALFDNVIMVKTKFLDDFTKTAEILMGFTIGKISQVGCFYLPHRLMSLITQKVLNFLIIFLFFLFDIKMPQFKHILAYIRLFLVLVKQTFLFFLF